MTDDTLITVPLNPTWEMIRAALFQMQNQRGPYPIEAQIQIIYRAMIEAHIQEQDA